MLSNYLLRNQLVYYFIPPLIALLLVSFHNPTTATTITPHPAQFKVPTSPLISSDYNYSHDHLVLATAVFYEAGVESLAGKETVANVILNRVKHKNFPNTYEEVIYDPYQFSFTLKLSLDKPQGPNWRDSLRIAAKVLHPNYVPVTDALYYYNPHLVATPTWASSRYFVGQVGNHRFYSWHKTI